MKVLIAFKNPFMGTDIKNGSQTYNTHKKARLSGIYIDVTFRINQLFSSRITKKFTKIYLYINHYLNRMKIHT